MTGNGLAALVLAAGEGRRLRPLTTLRPKPLCPIGATTGLDLALDRVATVVPLTATAVNAHHLAGQIEAQLPTGVHLSVEQPVPLGTAGAVGAIRDWLDGRDLLVTNGDVCFSDLPQLRDFVAGWDGVRPRLLVVKDSARPDFDGSWRFAGVSLVPARSAATLQAQPSGLYEVLWRHGDLDLVPTAAAYIDCADPSSYLAANLLLSGGTSVIGAGATVAGTLERCVVWPGAAVQAGEHLVEVVRARDERGRDVTVPAQ